MRRFFRCISPFCFSINYYAAFPFPPLLLLCLCPKSTPYLIARSTYTSVLYLGREYRRPEGSVHRPVLFEMLQAVLIFLCAHPSVTLRQLTIRFALAILPSTLVDILEVPICFSSDTASHTFTLHSPNWHRAGARFSSISNVNFLNRSKIFLEYCM